MSMKNFNEIIGNRNRDLKVCSAVPQPTAQPGAPDYEYNEGQIKCPELPTIHVETLK